MTEKRSDHLWLVNSSIYPTEEVWILARCAYDSIKRSLTPGQIMPRIRVKFTNTSHTFCGQADWTEYYTPDGIRCRSFSRDAVMWKRILTRIGKPSLFVKPVSALYGRFKDMPEYECRSYREAIVMIIAHEMEHATGTGSGKANEHTCELSAWDAVDYYRQRQTEIDGKINDYFEQQKTRTALQAQRIARDRQPEVIVAKELALAEKRFAEWTRRLRRALNKAKHYERVIKRKRKKLESLAASSSLACDELEPVRLAAKNPPNENNQ